MDTTLRQLTYGHKARVVRVTALGETAARMREMGLVPGALVEMKGRAPLRDPVALRLGGVTLALRNGEADAVAVEMCA